MSNLLEDGIDLKTKNVVKIAMKVGRFPLVMADYEWLDGKRKRTHKGIALIMKDHEVGGAGYAELDLDREKDRLIYEAFLKVQADPDEAERLQRGGIKQLDRDEIPAPTPWWDTAHWKRLVGEVTAGIRIMPDASQRKAFVTNCVKYELQRGDKARKGLIDALASLELDEIGVPASDPLAVPDRD